MIKNLLKTLVCSILILGLFSAGIIYSDEIDIGYKAPDFELADLDGNKVALKDFQDKVIALFFWATWCPYCRKEVPKLVKLNQEFNDKGLVILAIDYNENVNKLKQFAQKNSINYKILIDKTGEVFETYGIPGVPVVMFLDKQGIIRTIEFGLPSNYREILGKLLGEQAKQEGV